MSNNFITTTNMAPIPFKTIEEANKTLTQIPLQLINNYPIEPRLYKDFWLPELIFQGALTMQDDFKSRPTDLFIASYPKSGTTWLKALIFAIMTRTSYPLDQHPLLTNNPHECIGYLDMLCATGKSSLVEAIPSPRVLSTHLPYSILPDSITVTDCKIVYVWRDPKDVIVSQYYFLKDIFSKRSNNNASFNETFDSFCNGKFRFGPIWNHVLGYWQESLERPEKILFLKYENILHQPIKYVKMLANFIRYPFSEAEENQGMVEKIVELCSFKSLQDLEVNKTGKRDVLDQTFSNSSYFRKGLIGDWRNHLTPEMGQRLDDIVKEKFKGFGLEINNSDDVFGGTNSCINI